MLVEMGPGRSTVSSAADKWPHVRGGRPSSAPAQSVQTWAPQVDQWEHKNQNPDLSSVKPENC